MNQGIKWFTDEKSHMSKFRIDWRDGRSVVAKCVKRKEPKTHKRHSVRVLESGGGYSESDFCKLRTAEQLISLRPS